MKLLRRLIRLYKRSLCKYPLVTQSVQTGILMASGDIIAQKFLEKKCELDYLRTAQFYCLGLLTVGPVTATWYKLLARIVSGDGKSMAIKKVALDQLVFAPIFMVFFLVALNTLQGKDFDCIKRELSNKYIDIMISNYKLWPVAQLFNFYFTPVGYQVLVVQVVALAWNSYLSWKTQQEVRD